jgi:hypothetical protein
LATFFLKKVDPAEERTWLGKYSRAISEIPYHLAASGMLNELDGVLSDIKFIALKAVAGMAYELVNDYLRTESLSISTAAKERVS